MAGSLQGAVGAFTAYPVRVLEAARLRADATVPARVLGGLHVAGATLAVAWLALAQGSDTDRGGVAVCVGAAYAIGISLLTWARRVGLTALELVLGFTVVALISGASHFAGSTGDTFAAFYILAGVYAFAFFRPVHAIGHGALVAAAYAGTLAIAAHSGGLGTDATRWLMLVGVVFCAGAVVLALSEGLRRGELRFRRALDASSIASGLIDPEGRLAYANPALRHLLGGRAAGRDEVLAQALAPRGGRALSVALEAVRGGAESRVEIETQTGGAMPVDIAVMVSALGEREAPHVLVQMQDISDRVRALAANRQLAAVVQSSDDAIFTKDLDAVILTWNLGAERLYGYAAREIIGRSVAAIIPPERSHEATEAIERLKAGEPVQTLETVRLHRDGHRIDVSVTFAPIRDGVGALTSVAVIARDITPRLRLQREIADSERRYRLLFQRNPQPMWVYDRDTRRFLDVNECAIRNYGYTREEFLSMSIADIRPTEDLPRLERSLGSEHARLEEGDVWRHRTKSGKVIDVEVLADDFEFDGRPARLVIATDITARLAAERQLRHQADHDPLTGLWSRGRVEREIDALLAIPGEADCALVVLDIDHFKFVNDSFGHVRGDELLRRVAATLKDLAGPQARLGRLGGDEFALLLADAGEAQAREVAARMVSAIRERIREGRRRITASAGIAVSTRELHVSSAELLMAADIALYEAKDGGRDRCAVAVGVERGHTWIDEIRAALADDRLVLYAQPIIDLRTGATVREELLVRMIDARGELVQPASFIPASERFGLINEIDRWVVAHGLELALAGRRLEINLSAYSLGDPEIMRLVSGAIEQGLDPANLVFEITETAAAANYAEAADFALRLGRLGCGFALDDFGTGFGSLSYLKHVPIGYLKIDTEFVRGLASEPASQNIVRAVVTIASQLGQKTIAEGVEEASALELLRELGVDHGQGYHIARPGPATPMPAASTGGVIATPRMGDSADASSPSG